MFWEYKKATIITTKARFYRHIYKRRHSCYAAEFGRHAHTDLYVSSPRSSKFPFFDWILQPPLYGQDQDHMKFSVHDSTSLIFLPLRTAFG